MTAIDAARVAGVERVTFSGVAYRHLGPQHDPRSGEGARIQGGRFNPLESFPVPYLCLTRPCVVQEFKRLALRQTLQPEDLLPRRLFRYDIELVRILDLTNEETLARLELDPRDLVMQDRSLTQELGVIAHGLSLQGIRSYSATGVDEVLAVFSDHLATGKLEPSLEQEWDSLRDVEGN